MTHWKVDKFLLLSKEQTEHTTSPLHIPCLVLNEVYQTEEEAGLADLFPQKEWGTEPWEKTEEEHDSLRSGQISPTI